jgi:hypothetical protein
MNPRNTFLAAIALLSCAANAPAHHSAAVFDTTTEIVVEGIVTEVEWHNPHVYITVRDRNGTDWDVEAGPPGVLTRSGWKRDTLRRKQAVVLRGRPHRTPDKHELLLVQVSTVGADGKQTPVGKPLTPSSERKRATTLAGLWAGDMPSLQKFVPTLLAHPLTAAGRTAREAFRPEMDPAADCVSWTSPFIALATAIYPTRIELNGKTVILHSEFNGTRRVVHMDRREHPANGKASEQGDSIGWWEGKTLVVDTRLFEPTRSQFRDPYAGLPSGKDKHVVERYTLAADGRTLTLEFLMEDPEYMVGQLTGSVIWNYDPDLPFVPAKCDRKSAGQFLH